MKKRNSATAALTASRWKKISKKRRRKRSPARRLPRSASPNRSRFLRLQPQSPSPHRLLPVAEAAAASPQRKRKQPRSPLGKKRQRNPPRRRPRRRRKRNLPSDLRKRKRKKVSGVVNAGAGLERLRYSYKTAPNPGARFFIFPRAIPGTRVSVLA